MKNDLPDIYMDRTQGANVIQLRGHIFFDNTFRARKPRNEGSFMLAGRIRNRDEIKVHLSPSAAS